MDIRRRRPPPQEGCNVPLPASTNPVLTISLSIPLPVAWPRQLRATGNAQPPEHAHSFIELAFGEWGGSPAGKRMRRVARRGSLETARKHPASAEVAAPSFAVAMRQGVWWQAALAGLERRTRRLQVIRLLSL